MIQFAAMVAKRKAPGTRVGVVATFGLAAVIAFFAFSAWSSALPSGSDKFLHLLAFATLAIPIPFARPKLFFLVVLGVIVYGGLIEIVQSFVGRDASLADLVADATGALAGAAIGGWLGRLSATMNASHTGLSKRPISGSSSSVGAYTTMTTVPENSILPPHKSRRPASESD